EPCRLPDRSALQGLPDHPRNPSGQITCADPAPTNRQCEGATPSSNPAGATQPGAHQRRTGAGSTGFTHAPGASAERTHWCVSQATHPALLLSHKAHRTTYQPGAAKLRSGPDYWL